MDAPKGRDGSAKMAAAGAVAVNTNTNNREDSSREQTDEVQESKRTSQNAQAKDRYVFIFAYVSLAECFNPTSMNERSILRCERVVM